MPSHPLPQQSDSSIPFSKYSLRTYCVPGTCLDSCDIWETGFLEMALKSLCYNPWTWECDDSPPLIVRRHNRGFPGGCLPMQAMWIWSLGWEDPLEEGMAIHSCILAWRIPWTAWWAGVHGSQKSWTWQHASMHAGGPVDLKKGRLSRWASSNQGVFSSWKQKRRAGEELTVTLGMKSTQQAGYSYEGKEGPGRQPARAHGPQPCRRKKLDSANNVGEPGNGLSQRLPISFQTTRHLDLGLVKSEQRTQVCPLNRLHCRAVG